MQSTNSPNTNQNQASTPMAPAWLVSLGILAAIGFSLVSAPIPTNPPTAKPTASGTPSPISVGASTEIPAEALERETALMLRKAAELAPADPMCSVAIEPGLCMLRQWQKGLPLRGAALQRAIERQSGKVQL